MLCMIDVRESCVFREGAGQGVGREPGFCSHVRAATRLCLYVIIGGAYSVVLKMFGSHTTTHSALTPRYYLRQLLEPKAGIDLTDQIRELLGHRRLRQPSWPLPCGDKARLLRKAIMQRVSTAAWA